MLEDVLELRTTMWPSRYRGNSTCEEWWILCVSSRRRDRLGLELFPRIVGIVSPSIDVRKRLKGIFRVYTFRSLNV